MKGLQELPDLRVLIVAINRLNDLSPGQVLNGKGEIKENEIYTEYSEVTDYQTDYEIYLHSYLRDGLIYTFVGEKGKDEFVFYYILKQDLTDLGQ